MLDIRRADRGDAKALSRLAESTFRAAFGAQNTAEQMAVHCRDSYGERIQAAEISDPEMLTLLCEDDGRLIGYAQLRWGEAPACVAAGSPGELQRLYVVEDRHGMGVAQALMTACIEAMRQRGSDVVWLGVWERNPRALAFYRKFGFVEMGDQIFSLGGDPQRDIVMARPLTAA